MIDERYPVLARLVAEQVRRAPDQEKFFAKRFESLSPESLVRHEELAGHIAKLIAHDEDGHFADYAWWCAEQLNEELYFRRHKKYRLSTFEEARRLVYSNREFMARYMNGLLMTQIWWKNHFDIIEFYRTKFLPGTSSGARHLEIGPGHGLFLYFAAMTPAVGNAVAWDVAASSVNATRHALALLGAEGAAEIEERDMMAPTEDKFDNIVFSEVLEHLDRPREALDVIARLLAPGGRLFLNMPINSPAPDHLFNMDTPEELVEYVESSGFVIDDQGFFPATNQTLDMARKKKLTISCAFIARRR